MKLIALLALVFIVFELAQLVLAHRYIGPEQIRRNAHPLTAAAPPLPFMVSVGWVVLLGADYLYQLTLVVQHYPLVQICALLMIMASIAGFLLRRACGVKWGMVVMTFEAAVRVGCLSLAFRMIAFPPFWANRVGLGLF
jgi:hypothetical protein